VITMKRRWLWGIGGACGILVLATVLLAADQTNLSILHSIERLVIGGNYCRDFSQGIVTVEEDRVLAKVRTPDKPLWPGDAAGLVLNPLLVEAAFQTCGYRDLHFEKRTTLPDSVGAVLVWPSKADGELFVDARFKGKDPSGKSVYDAFVVRSDGTLAAELQDYKMVPVG